MATAWIAESLRARRERAPHVDQPRENETQTPRWPMATIVLFGLLAAVPDFDFLFRSHRTVTHSFGAVAAVGITVALLAAWNGRPALYASLVAAIAYATHPLLDWMTVDHSMSPGIMALWPLSREHYVFEFKLFLAPSYRYWDVTEFVRVNSRYFFREMLLLGPPALGAWLLWRRKDAEPTTEEWQMTSPLTIDD